METVETILRKEGPMLSSALSARLQELGATPQAARQRIARAGKSVSKLRGLTFPKGARFLYLESSFNSRGFWQALIRDIGTASPSYSAAFAALRARGGIVPKTSWPIICGSPLRQKGQVSSETVLERLVKVSLVKEVEVAGIGSCVRLDAGGIETNSESHLRARLTTERILILAVKEWVRRLAMGSFDKINCRGDGEALPTVGTFAWDLTAPSYLRPFVRRGAGGTLKPGFLACDVAVGEDFDAAAVGAFLRKCDLLASMKGLSPVLPILVADGYSLEAFKLARSKGIIATTPTGLFGREVATGLRSLLATLTNAAAVATQKPEVIERLFNDLGRIEGAAGNLRGALFELLVGHAVSKVEGGSIDIGRRVVDAETQHVREIDVLRVREDQEVAVYECKARQPDERVSPDMVSEWLGKIPAIRSALRSQDRFREIRMRFEYWTCGTLAPDAEALLEKKAEETRKYAIAWKGGEEIRTYLRRLKNTTVGETFDQHFMSHTVAKTARRFASERASWEDDFLGHAADALEDIEA